MILNLHSHYSILHALHTPQELVDECVKKEYKVAGLTDRFSLAGCIQFHTACREAGIKPVLGTEVLIRETEFNHTLTLLAKNKQGWKNLLKIVSESNREENIIERRLKKKKDHIPSATLDLIKEYSDNLICLTGGIGSKLDALRLRGESTKAWTDELSIMFGDGLFPNFDSGYYYIEEKDHDTLRILLASLCGSTLEHLNRDIVLLADPLLEKLARSNEFAFRPSEKVDAISEMVEDYELKSAPLLPHFPTPNGESESEYLRLLCREGWKLNYEESWDKTIYGDRVKKEMADIVDGGIDGYLLIVQDFIKEAHRRGFITAPGRGSVSGSLCAFLLGITQVDPIQYDLIWERFYNSARKGSLADIDTDFEPSCRDQIIEYVREKYGQECVSQMATYGTLQAKAAIKEVLRTYGAASPSQMDEITKEIPDKAKIEGEMKEVDEVSFIRHILKTTPNLLKDYCKINKEGNIEGSLGFYFEQAIKIENRIKSTGKHAAGVIISSQPISEVAPLIYDKSSEFRMMGLEMEDGEFAGLVKFDFLNTAVLSKIKGAENLFSSRTVV